MTRLWRTALAVCLLTTAAVWRNAGAGVHYTVSGMKKMIESEKTQSTPTVFAARLADKPDGDGFPSSSAWHQAPMVQFDHDWRGENEDPQRATEVRLLWAPETLYIQLR
jgi:hypothetical protein